MILLEEVVDKLNKILNKQDDEVDPDLIPFDYYFQVVSEGYFQDKIYIKEKMANFIPTYASFIGGQFDPVPNLQRGTFNVRVDFWLPVRFKKDFYVLNKTLNDIFVAKFLNFGPTSGTCLCNVSPINVGEIQDMDLKQFEKWVNDVYSMPIEIMEKWMNISFTLFLTSSTDAFIYGNNVQYELEFKSNENVAIFLDGLTPYPIYETPTLNETISSTLYYAYKCYKNNTTYYSSYAFANIVGKTLYIKQSDGTLKSSGYAVGSKQADTQITHKEELVWTSSGTGYGNSPISQQLIDNPIDYAKNTKNIINYNKSIIAYFRDNEFWRTFLDYYNKNKGNIINEITLKKKYTIGKDVLTYTYDQVVLSINENVTLGELLSFTLTFGD